MLFDQTFRETENYFGLNDLNRALTQWYRSKGKRDWTMKPSLIRLGLFEQDSLESLATSHGDTILCSGDSEVLGIKIERLESASHLELID